MSNVTHVAVPVVARLVNMLFDALGRRRQHRDERPVIRESRSQGATTSSAIPSDD